LEPRICQSDSEALTGATCLSSMLMASVKVAAEATALGGAEPSVASRPSCRVVATVVIVVVVAMVPAAAQYVPPGGLSVMRFSAVAMGRPANRTVCRVVGIV